MKRLFALFLALSPLPLLADDAKPKQGPFVVLVGISDYADKAIQPRPTAAKDAAALYDVFTDPQYGDVAKDRAVLLTNDKATREAIVKAVHEAVAKTSKDDLIVLGFFGRGTPVSDGTGLFAADSTAKDRAKNTVLGSDLATELKAAKNRKIMLLLDAHFKGFDAGKDTLVEPTLGDVFKAVYGTGEDREEDPNVSDKLIILATTPSHDPLAKDGHGLLAIATIDALKGKADTEGYEPDGMIMADELTKYLEKEGGNLARSVGKNTKEKESVPFIVGEETSHFPLSKNPVVTPTVTKRVKALKELFDARKLEQDVYVEGLALVYHMPKLKSQQELRKAYIKLADNAADANALTSFNGERATIKESMVLPAADATEFAKRTFSGIEQLQVKYIKKLTNGELTAHAIKGVYRRLELPVPKDIDDALKDAKDLPDEKLKDLLAQMRTNLGKREDLDGVKDVDMALMMMTFGLNDPYTVYLDKETVKKNESGWKANFSGIGIHIRRDMARDGLLCVAPIKGSPAYKAGMKAGDLITEVRRDVDAEGKPITDEKEKVISTKGMKMDDALKLILGKPGVPVTVIVEREGEKAPLTFTINRGRVSLETVLGVKRDAKDDWTYWIDEDNKIAYVYMTQFGPQTYTELKRVVESCNRLGMKGMVLDLRHNPGGMLSAALMISDMFIESGKIVTVKPRVGREENYYDEGYGEFTKFPMAVLVNGNSASASEIVSAALQDYGRAVVIGERSYGKGSVQTIEKFGPTQGEFKFTTARYFPPLGRNIDKLSTPGKPEDEWGVKPNDGYEVKLSREEKQDLAELLRDKELLKKPEVKEGKAPFKDTQLDKALDYLRKEIGVVAKK